MPDQPPVIPWNLGPKALDCLRLAAAVPLGSSGDAVEWDRLHQAACARWAQKAIMRKAEELARKGYLEPGVVHPIFGWLTDKGRAALELAESRV